MLLYNYKILSTQFLIILLYEFYPSCVIAQTDLVHFEYIMLFPKWVTVFTFRLHRQFSFNLRQLTKPHPILHGLAEIPPTCPSLPRSLSPGAISFSFNLRELKSIFNIWQSVEYSILLIFYIAGFSYNNTKNTLLEVRRFIWINHQLIIPVIHLNNGKITPFGKRNQWRETVQYITDF